MTNTTSRTIVVFPFSENGQLHVENLHALPVGTDLYRLDNSPFYVYGISLGDIIYAPLADGRPLFVNVVAHEGHSTYRLRLPIGQGHSDFIRHWKTLEKLGCSYEGSSAASRRLYSIDVPPGSNVNAIYRILEDGEHLGWWEFEEAHYCNVP